MGTDSSIGSNMKNLVGYDALAGAHQMMETLENLGIDFNVRWFGSKTGLHKRFKNQPNPQGEDATNSYASRKHKDDLVQRMYESIGSKGGNNEGPALKAVIKDIQQYGSDEHYVIVFTDGMGQIDEIKKILQGVRDNGSRVGRSKTQFVGVGLGNQTKIVPEVYGEEHSIFLKDDELDLLPVRIKKLMQKLISGIYLGETQEKKAKKSSRIGSNHGLISQGDESLAIFKYRLSQGKYDNSRREDLEERFAEHLNGQKVYVIPQIVKSSKDFLLGYRDIKNGRIYVSQEVVDALKDNPDALAEYLFHEAHCEGENHYEVIAKQQERFFEANYEGRGYEYDKGKGYWVDPANGKIAKGVLKDVLSGQIDAQVRSEAFLYESMDEAIAVYQQEHGEPDPELMSMIEKNLPNYLWWVKKFGLNDLMELSKAAGKNADSLLQFGLPAVKGAFGQDFERYWPEIVELGKAARENSFLLFNDGLPAVRDLIKDAGLLLKVGNELVELGKLAGENAHHLYLCVFVAQTNFLSLYGENSRRALKDLRNLIDNEDAAAALVELFKETDLVELGKGRVIRRLSKIASADENVDKAEELRDLLKTLKDFDVVDEFDDDPYAVMPAVQKAPDSATAVMSGNFSMSEGFVVDGTEGLTNSQVGDQLSEKLDVLGISAVTETQVSGDILSFIVGEASNIKESDKEVFVLASILRDYFKSQSYKELSEETRSLFESTRLVALGGQAFVARREGKGSSYAHFGMAGDSMLPSLYMGRDLIEYLAENRVADLSTLIKIEMNRRAYRIAYDQDNRSSIQVVKDAGITPQELQSLKEAIAEVEARILIEKLGAQKLAGAIIESSEQIDRRGAENIVVDGVELGQLRGPLLAAVVKHISSQIEQSEERSRITDAVDRIREFERQAGQDKLIGIIEENIDSASQGVEIDMLMGEVRIFQGIGQDPVALDIDEDMTGVINRMVGGVSSDVEKVFIDILRGPVSFSDILESLVEGNKLSAEESRINGGLVLERIVIDNVEIIHISSGSSNIRSVRYKAEALSAFDSFVEEESGLVPVGIDVSILENMTDQDRDVFVAKNWKIMALIGDSEKISSIEKLYKDYQERFKDNRFRYENEVGPESKMLVAGDGMKQLVAGADILRINSKEPDSELTLVMDLARFIASIGKEEAIKSKEANRLLTEVLKSIYEEGQIPVEFLTEHSLEEILGDPDGFLFPPIAKTEMKSIESYLRAKRYVETMA
ncbi:MAG: hypothetical protein P9M03_00230 [Candidatus Theseobacter exili]|nr:hypothetical protein [Candidatus Theseobacter exili]